MLDASPDFPVAVPSRAGSIVEFPAPAPALALHPTPVVVPPAVPVQLARVLAMERFVALHATGPLRLADIARAAGLSPAYACAVFREVRGMTLGESITRVRLRHARRLLAGTDAKVIEVALEAGFGSAARFYAAFRRHCGELPQTFRDRAQRARGPATPGACPTPALPPAAAARDAHSPRLFALWVDDQPLNNARERRLLARAGIYADAYTRNADALSALDQAPFDFVISDIGRGAVGETGWDLLRAVRERHPRTPVIFYTGHAHLALRRRATLEQAFGACDRSAELLELVCELLPRPTTAPGSPGPP